MAAMLRFAVSLSHTTDIMDVPRISASSYSNTAPLIWSFLYGQNHGVAEVILDTAPARSAELLAAGRVDAALVPVIASQFIDGVRLVPGVAVAASRRVRSVCLITAGKELKEVRSVALDTSSRTSATLIKIIFREFVGIEPAWVEAKPDAAAMLTDNDAALLIGDPALAIAETRLLADGRTVEVFDLASLWHEHTGLGFIFAMWMTRKPAVGIDFAAARDEGLRHIDEIISNYITDIPISREEMRTYLTQNIAYSPDEKMLAGMELYLNLAARHKLIPRQPAISYLP